MTDWNKQFCHAICSCVSYIEIKWFDKNKVRRNWYTAIYKINNQQGSTIVQGTICNIS